MVLPLQTTIKVHILATDVAVHYKGSYVAICMHKNQSNSSLNSLLSRHVTYKQTDLFQECAVMPFTQDARAYDVHRACLTCMACRGSAHKQHAMSNNLGPASPSMTITLAATSSTPRSTRPADELPDMSEQQQ